MKKIRTDSHMKKKWEAEAIRLPELHRGWPLSRVMRETAVFRRVDRNISQGATVCAIPLAKPCEAIHWAACLHTALKAATCALHTWEHIPGCWSLTSQDLEKGQTKSIIFHFQLLIEWKHIMKKYILWQHWWHSTAYGISLCHKQWQLVVIIYYKKLRF